MIDVALGWQLEIDESPEWLFVRVIRVQGDAVLEPPLADAIWSLAANKETYRLVAEWQSAVPLRSHVIGQLVLLHKRCHQHDGTLRLCAFPAETYEAFRVMRLADRFPNYRDREAAVNGWRD
jgi:anti-anti-sigma regulatory factor